MHPFLSFVMRKIVYPTGRALSAYGQLYIPVILPQFLPRTHHEEPRRPAEREVPVLWRPAPGHPERLRPDLPLSAVEAELLRQLDPKSRPGHG